MTGTVHTVLQVVVELSGPWLVGDPTGAGDVDTVPLRELDGTPQVTATSLAGSLRERLRTWPGDLERVWMGERQRRDDDRGQPSRLRVLGVGTSGGEHTVRRTTTAVDTWTGAAARATLRREEHVEGATTVTVYLTHDGEPDQVLLDAIGGWRPVVGRRRTNGWGRSAATNIRYGRVDLRDPEQLVAWLTGGGPKLVDALASMPVSPGPAVPEEDLLSIRCAVVGGLHVGTGERAELSPGERQEPVRSGQVAGTATRGGTGYLPASAWRGVFRSHAGFLLRSLGLPGEAADARVQEVFGSVAHRGLLTFHDSPIEVAENLRQWHVGIDRITGGARPGLLFGEQVVRGTMRLRVSAARAADVPEWARNLLLHTVRDIADGLLAVGGRTTRGLGTLAVLDPPPGAGGIDVENLAQGGPE